MHVNTLKIYLICLHQLHIEAFSTAIIQLIYPQKAKHHLFLKKFGSIPDEIQTICDTMLSYPKKAFYLASLLLVLR